MLQPTQAKRLLDDNPRFRVSESAAMEACDELKWKRQTVREYLAGWATGWIELVDEDKERLGRRNGFCVEIGRGWQAVMARCAANRREEGRWL